MEYSAIFHDMDKRFCYAIDKDLFVIRVQVKKDDIKEIMLHYEDKYIPLEWKDTRKTIPMKKVATSQFHDYYEAQLQLHLICLRYYFEFTDMQGEKVYYGNYEFSRECITNRDRCSTVRKTFVRKKCLRCRSGQQIRSCIRFFHLASQRHSQ